MIIVDTSIWIEFLKQNPTVTEEMVRLLENREVTTIEPIFSELIYGVRNESEKNKVVGFWKILPKVVFGNGVLIDAASFANKSGFQNKGIGLIDAVIIKASIDNNYKVWTLDNKLKSALNSQYIYK